MRVINKIVTGLPRELVGEVSPRSAKIFRPFVKASLLLIMLVCGIMTGLNLVAFDLLGSMLQSQTFSQDVGLTVFLSIVAASFSVLLLLITNFVMARYDQIVARPIYESNVVIWTILSALILLNELSLYTRASFSGLLIMVGVIVLGIVLLGVKKTRISMKESDWKSEIDKEILGGA